MPRVVDHDGRRAEITQAAMAILAREGTSGLTMRALAREMGGSLTLVTHYYPNRAALMSDFARQLTLTWLDELELLQRGVTDPVKRLRLLIDWLLPLTDEGRTEEQTRFALLMDRNDEDCRAVLIEFDRRMRVLLREHLKEILPPREVGPAVNLLRAVTNGVVLDVMLEPEHWTPRRQRTVVNNALESILRQRSS